MLGILGVVIPFSLQLFVGGSPVGFWPDDPPRGVGETVVLAGNQTGNDLNDGIEDDREHDESGEDPSDAVAPRRNPGDRRVIDQRINEQKQQQHRRRDGPCKQPIDIRFESQHQLAVLAEIPETVDPHQHHALGECDEQNDKPSAVRVQQTRDQTTGLTSARQRQQKTRHGQTAADDGFVGSEDAGPFVGKPGDDGF